MMKRSIAVVLVLFLAGCSAKVVGIYNPGSLKTIPKTFHVYFPEEEDTFSPERQQLDQQLVEIITKRLSAKSLTQSSIPDLYVSFIISVHTTEEFNQVSRNPYDLRYRYYNYGMYDPTLFNSQSFKEGVLIIDIKNGENKLVWQGSKAFKLNARKSSTAELLASCQEIIAAFDPGMVN